MAVAEQPADGQDGLAVHEVDGASSVQSVTIEALGVVVRLPVESPVERIVAVASGLGRAS